MAIKIVEVSEALEKRFWAKVKRTRGCWFWTAAKTTSGYGVLGSGQGKSVVRATHVSWLLAGNLEIPIDKFICHTCDEPACVRPSHLFIGTANDNYADMAAKGRNSLPPILRGERNGYAKLCVKDIRRIKRLAKGKIYHREIAILLGVSRPCITAVLQERNWRGVR